MGKRSREHKAAVIAGTKEPFRAAPDKPRTHEPVEPVKESADEPGVIVVSDGSGKVIAVGGASKADDLLERIRRLKEQGG